MEGNSGNESTGSTAGYSGGSSYGGGGSYLGYTTGQSLDPYNLAYDRYMAPGASFAEEHPVVNFFAGIVSGLFGGAIGGAIGAKGLTALKDKITNTPGLSQYQRDQALGEVAKMSPDDTPASIGKSMGFDPQGDAGSHGDGVTPQTFPNTTAPNADGATAATTTTSSSTLDDLISSHFGDGAEKLDFTMGSYNDDPTGLVAQSAAYAKTTQDQGQANYNQLAGLVDQYGSESYQAQQRGRAMADVQQQSDAAYQSAQRDQMRMGVNPESGRMAAMGNQRAMQTALGKVSAAANSDSSLRDTYAKGLASLQTANSDMAKASQGWGALGNDAAKNGLAWSLGSSELGLKAATQNQNNAYNWGSLANQKYGIDQGVATSAAKNATAEDMQTTGNLWSLAGLGLNAASKADWSNFWGGSSSSTPGVGADYSGYNYDDPIQWV